MYMYIYVGIYIYTHIHTCHNLGPEHRVQPSPIRKRILSLGLSQKCMRKDSNKTTT